MDKFRMTINDNILFAKRNIVDSIYEGRVVSGLSVEDTYRHKSNS